MIKKERKKSNKRVIINLINSLIFVLSLFVVILTNYILTVFSDVTFEQLLFSIQTAEGTSDTMFINGAKYVVFRVFLILMIFYIFKILLSFFFKTSQVLMIKVGTREIKITLAPLSNLIKIFLAIIFLLLSICYCFKSLGIIDYFESNNTDSKFIVTNYIDPKKVKITSPSSKRNLIYIYVESLETSLFSFENGGNFKKTVIPNLEKIALENTNFSNTNNLGGGFTPNGTGWTVAGMVSSTTGLPLKLPFEGNSYKGYGEFLPGAYSLGDVLKDNGYSNYLFIGSDATFGGRKDYFTYHGRYNIYDYYTAKEKKWLPSNYIEWWGYEDSKLYEFAEKKLLEIADKDEPFNFTMLTADTHPTDGYIDKSCNKPYAEKYLNAYNCADTMLIKFIDWIKQQKFYKNTTIVIIGDHLSMQKNLLNMYDVDKQNPRRTYNVFINPVIDSVNEKDRSFTTFDYYPTTLAALGFDIEGDRLGLGINLFSSKKTLAEEYGINQFNKELTKKSNFYNNELLKLKID